MSSNRLCIIAILLGLSAAISLAQGKDEAAHWTAVLRKTPMKELPSKMREEGLPAWPIAPSREFIKELPEDEKAWAEAYVALVLALIQKVKLEFEPDALPSAQEIDGYAAIAKTLEAAKGYSNRVAADVFRRLALYRIVQALVQKSLPIDAARRLVAKMEVPAMKVPALLEGLAAEDSAIRRRMDAIRSTDPERSVDGLFQSLGLDPFDQMKKTASDLIESSSGTGLAFRLIETEFMYAVALPGLMLFLEKGGLRTELDLADPTLFARRVGDAGAKFSYPPLQIRGMEPSHVRSLFELGEQSETRAQFLKKLLE